MGIREVFADTRPLRDDHFRRLWTANIVTVIGAQLTVVAVPAQIYHITGSSAYVGLTGVFGLVPLVVFGLWGGAISDAHDRRTVLLVTTGGLVLTTGLLWAHAASGMNDVWVMLGLFAAQQAFFAVNQPTRSAILPALLPGELLPAANSLNMTLMQFGAIGGPLLGGALIPVLGYSWLYLLDTLSLGATLWAVLRLPPLPPSGAAPPPGLRSVLDGLAYLRGHPVVLASFLVDIIAMVFGMPRALFPEMAERSFGDPAGGGMAFALLSAAIAAGAVVGGVFSGWVSRVERQGLAVIVCITLWGAAIAGFGVAVGLADATPLPWLPVAVGLLMVGGAADVASAAFRMSMLQESATEEVRGRLQGVFIVVVAGGPRIADVAHGGAAVVVGTAVAAAGGGLLVVIGMAVCVVALPAFVRYRVRR